MAYNVHEKWLPEQITKYYSHITVSRDDVEKYEVVDFPIETRFFKLPVEGFLDVEGLFPRPAQIPVINALNDPKYRFIVAPLARRSGKSFISFNLAFLKSMEPNSKILLVAPNYSLANIGWTQINELTDKYQIDTSKRNSKDKEIFYENGSMIKIASISQISSAVGRSYDLVIWDEYAHINNNIPSVFPGIAKSWTIDNASSITELTNGFLDSSRDYTTTFNIQMHSQLSNSRQSGTTIFSSDLYNIFRASRNVGFGNYTQPIFCTIKPTNSAGPVEFNSRNSTISVNGSPLLYPGMAAIYNTRIGATYYSYGGSNSYVRVTPVSSESGYTSIDIANIPNVFSTRNGAGLLTVSTSYLMDTNTLAFDGISWDTDTSGYYSFGANDYTSRHASLMALSDGQMFTLFTAGIGCDYYITYGHYRAGFQYTCYLRRSGNNLIISIRYNVYLSPKWRPYHKRNGYVDLWYQIPAFAFSFKEFNS